MDNPVILSLSDLTSLARLLKVQLRNLSYLVYKVGDEERYNSFTIPKKRGGFRMISAPDSRLKTIQRRLAAELLKVYPSRGCVHGFSKDKSIRSNARLHLHKRWVINIDIKDFFPSIHFGRVVGVFKARPFEFNDRLAREIANLCCYNNTLPQGAPTSPIVSNFVCWRLDNELSKLAKSCKCVYSRYADDITFSTNLKEIPAEIGRIDGTSFILSDKLLQIISNNSFDVNPEKVRYAGRNNRQEVTGLIVNTSTTNVRRTYLRQVRAMLNACEKYGLSEAAREHYSKYRPDKKPKDQVAAFMSEIEGKIGYIRFIKQIRQNGESYDSPIIKNLRNRLKSIYPESKLSATKLFIAESDRPVILGEGKTDWKYIKKALTKFQEKKEFVDLDLNFRQYDARESSGCKSLLQFCQSNKLDSPQIVICVFDRDVQEIIQKASCPGKPYKYWGHNIYSIVLPKPKEDFPDLFCIEQYFSRDEIMTTDESGHRLYLSDEFDSETGIHKRNVEIKYGKEGKDGSINYLKNEFVRVIEANVWDKEGRNIALPKSAFSDYIYADKDGFNNFDCSNFKHLFDIIREILEL